MNQGIDLYLLKINNKQTIKKFEQDYMLNFPLAYKTLVNDYDGIILKKCNFKYYDHSRKLWTMDYIGYFLCWNSSKGELLRDTFVITPPEFFPSGVIAFADNGGGDYLCFDYRTCRENPPIVLWKHERLPGDDILLISHTFDDFLNGLEEDSPILEECL